MKMGDEPGIKAGDVIVELLMTSAYAASLAFFHKAIDLISQKGINEGVSKTYVELPAKTEPAKTYRNTTQSVVANRNVPDDEVFQFYR